MEKWIRLFHPFPALVALLFSIIPLPALGQATGSISGTVTETGTSTPLVGVMVYTYLHDGSVGTSGMSFTDEDGEYTITDLAEGAYVVRANPSDQNYIAEYFDDTVYSTDADAVTVTAGENTPDINFELAPGGMISGTIVDSNDVGIENIWISAHTDCYGGFSTMTTTDASGAYTLMGLPAGEIYLQASNYPFNTVSYISEWYDDAEYCMDASPVSVSIGSTTGNINFQLELAGSISGTVYESDGITPVADMPVGVFSDPCDSSWFVATATNESGEYSLRGLTPGNFYVKVSNDILSHLDWPEQNYLREWYDSMLSCEEATPVEITGGIDAGEVNFLLFDDADIDGDSIPDEWEWAYFGDTSRDGSQDYDEDGVTDLQEYLEGTDPATPDTETDSGGGGGGGGCFISTVL
jgi:hypothetical protein